MVRANRIAKLPHLALHLLSPKLNLGETLVNFDHSMHRSILECLKIFSRIGDLSFDGCSRGDCG